MAKKRKKKLPPLPMTEQRKLFRQAWEWVWTHDASDFSDHDENCDMRTNAWGAVSNGFCDCGLDAKTDFLLEGAPEPPNQDPTEDEWGCWRFESRPRTTTGMVMSILRPPIPVASTGVPNNCPHENHGLLRHKYGKLDLYGCLDCLTLAHGYECKCAGCMAGNHIRC